MTAKSRGSGSQPTPTVTRADVERVVRRDFPPGQIDSILSVLAAYGDQTWHGEPHRVHLAALKWADGSLDKLRRAIETAKCDFRDVLAYAEYPAYMKKSTRISQLPAAERRKIIDEDWKQYETWLKK